MRARVVASALVLSASALVSLVAYEGYSSRAYLDSANVPTIGFGTTRYEDGTPVQMGDVITPQRALIRLVDDANAALQAVQRCANVPMFQHEIEAWTHFVYNVGQSAFCRSTAARKLREGDYAGACDEMLRWVYAGGRRIEGLAKRRAQERLQCLGIVTGQ